MFISASTHVMDETRPSPFFALFHFRLLYWTQTDEQKTGEAWERGYKRRACVVPIYACAEQRKYDVMRPPSLVVSSTDPALSRGETVWWNLKCSSQDKPLALTSQVWYAWASWGSVMLDYKNMGGCLHTLSIPIWSISHFVNSHWVNVDKVGIDRVHSRKKKNMMLSIWTRKVNTHQYTNLYCTGKSHTKLDKLYGTPVMYHRYLPTSSIPIWSFHHLCMLP